MSEPDGPSTTPDGIAANTSVVVEFFRAVSDDRFDRVRELVDPDGSWWTLGSRTARPSAVIVDLLEDLHHRSTNGLRFDVGALTAEADRVAARVEGHAEFVDNGVYNNLYHFLLRVVDGRIVQAWEYYDTALSNQVFRKTAPPAQ